MANDLYTLQVMGKIDLWLHHYGHSRWVSVHVYIQMGSIKSCTSETGKLLLYVMYKSTIVYTCICNSIYCEE